MKKFLSILLLFISLLIPGQAFAKTAYLSFDDGPSRCTQPILDVLAKHKVKATFFVMATRDPGHMHLYKEMIKQGHTLGLHTYSHNYAKIYRSEEAYFKDLQKLEEFLKKEVGVTPKILRFPGGSNNYVSKQYAGRNLMNSLKQEVVKKGYQFYDWNCEANDGLNPPVPEKTIIQRITNSVGNQENLYVLLHDFNSNTTAIDALPEIIQFLKKKGYDFKVMDETTPEYHFK